ncbi:ABC transporter permease [Gordonia sp. NPDC003376]
MTAGNLTGGADVRTRTTGRAQAVRDAAGRLWRHGPWVVLALVAAFAVLVPVLAGDQSADFAGALRAPGDGTWLGTDHSGYDLGVRTAEGLRISLLIAALCAVISTVLGLVVGIGAVTIGGWFDAVVMRVVDGVNALPHLVVGVVIAAMWRGDPVAIIASIALTHWPSVARVVRAELLDNAHAGWIESARLAGASRWFVARRHLLPAVTGQALVAMIILLPHAVWHETTLSFLGVGLSPDAASLGTLLGQARGDVLTGAWWTLVVPGLALIIAALACTAAGSALRRDHRPPSGEVW